MAWEQRGSRRYYYRASKVNNRVQKAYLGNGRLAEVAADQDVRARQLHRYAAERRRRDSDAILALDAPVDVFTDTLETLMRTSLLLAGYHRHHGSEWRKRRHGK